MKKLWVLLISLSLLLCLLCTAQGEHSAALADGSYIPQDFSFSGGTGKVTITCQKVTIEDGKATATIVFSSSSYGYVKVDGIKYYGTNDAESSTFQIPVNINANSAIIGMTNKMSMEHEIAYTIFVGISKTEDAKALPTNEAAPQIIGLTYQSTDEILHAENFAIHRYCDGFILLEVVDAMPVLLAPESAEIPAGLESKMQIVQMPVTNAYAASEDTLAWVETVGAVDRITLTGLTRDRSTIESILSAMDSGQIQFAGNYDEPDYAKLLMQDCALAILPSPILHSDGARTLDQFTLLGIPTLVDRSMDEKSELARDEWIKLFDVLFGQEEIQMAQALSDLTYESSLDIQYAECFAVDYYIGGYALIDVYDSRQYLVVPEQMPIPQNLDPEIIILQQPLRDIYLVATSAMALFDRLDCLDAISLTGTNVADWYIPNAVKALESGAMLYAGKYSQPDYELLIKQQCDLAIQSTMILQSPKVMEMIELLGVPVLIDYSSYEAHPLGRTEWIKLYGVLMDKEEEASTFFDTQAKIVDSLKSFFNTEKTVAFFYISMDGSVVVRNANDYVARMIEIAGGHYSFEGIGNADSKKATTALTMEAFYEIAVDADYLIYNASIDSPIASMDDLLAKNDLFADFKAVREGNVWCAQRYLFQATDITGKLIIDIHQMLTGINEPMTFLHKVD